MTIYHKLSTRFSLYNVNVEFVIVDDCNDYWKATCKKRKLKFTDDDNSYFGLFFAIRGTVYIAISQGSVDYFTVSHEIYHATQEILGSRGIKDEESHAYLSGHINNIIYKFLHSKNIEVSYAK